MPHPDPAAGRDFATWEDLRQTVAGVAGRSDVDVLDEAGRPGA